MSNFRISNINIPASSPLENQAAPDTALDGHQASAGSAGVPDSIGSEDYQFNFGWPSAENPFQSQRAVEDNVSFIRTELSKTDPDESSMFQRLMSLTPEQDVQVLSELRTNGDVYRLVDDLFSNSKIAPQMGQLSDKLKSVLSQYPGIQDIISEIDKRSSSLPKNSSSQPFTSGSAMSALSDGAIDIGGAGVEPSVDLSGYGGFASFGTTEDDPLAELGKGKADPDENKSPASLTSRFSTESEALSTISDGTTDVGGVGVEPPFVFAPLGAWGNPIEGTATFQQGIDSTYSFIEEEMSKSNPDGAAMIDSLLALSPEQDAMVIHHLRTDGDISRFLDDITSNPSARPQLQQLMDQFKLIISKYPGMQDVISEIEKRLM
jgi:hypothetical protein